MSTAIVPAGHAEPPARSRLKGAQKAAVLVLALVLGTAAVVLSTLLS